MELIISTIEKTIKDTEYDISYYSNCLQSAKNKLNQLNIELAELKVKLGEPTPGHEHNSFQKTDISEFMQIPTKNAKL
jgi:hypothetical protein